MKRLSILFLCLLFATAIVSCKKPASKKTAPTQQSIETPVMQMAEKPVTGEIAPSKTQAAGQTPSAPPKSTVVASEEVSVPASTTVVKSTSNIEIIIDASGSMNAPIGTTTKIEAVKSALKEAFSVPLPPEISNRKIAIRSFGEKSPAEQNDCTDTALDLPMKKYHAEEFSAALEKISPKGITPLAFALEEAGRDFNESAESADNIIILISDGLDSCNSDPLAAVNRMHKKDSKVIVNVIALDVDQASQESLKGLATASSGAFFFARSDVELASAIDQAASANLPYNLRLKVLSGASPVPSTITVFRANTQSVVERADSSGMKFFRLQPGSYDIMVEYRNSIESKKPSKIIKGVEVTATTKAEQIVQFDLGNLNLTALDQNGQEIAANFYLRKSGSEEIVGTLSAVKSPKGVYLSPGTYDLDAESAEPGVPTLTAQIKEINVAAGKTTDQSLKFQTGKLSLKAQNVSKQNVPTAYRITKPESADVIASGEGAAEGVVIDLPPGNYDVYVAWRDPNIQGSPEAKLPNVSVVGGETIEQSVTIVTGTMKLSGKDNHSKPVPVDFSIKKTGSEDALAKVTSNAAPVEVFVAPGSYDIVATDTTSKIVPAPSIAWTDVEIKEGQTKNLDAVFKLGTLKLIGKNAKQQSMSTTFTVYRAGTDDPLVVESSEKDWVMFNLTPSLYDVKAEDAKAKSDPKPNIWFHDLEIKEGQTTANEAIFTSGKLKLICRGKNSSILTCEFNIFTYGSDTALFSGETADEWREFDIPPGKYYMEAGWHDPKEEQFLKKWINVSIGENEIVEEVLRF